MAVPDALHVLGMDEMVAPLPHNVHGGQIHVITNPTRTGTQAGIQGRGNSETLSNTLGAGPLTHFRPTTVPVGTQLSEGKPFHG